MTDWSKLASTFAMDGTRRVYFVKDGKDKGWWVEWIMDEFGPFQSKAEADAKYNKLKKEYEEETGEKFR